MVLMYLNQEVAMLQGVVSRNKSDSNDLVFFKLGRKVLVLSSFNSIFEEALYFLGSLKPWCVHRHVWRR